MTHVSSANDDRRTGCVSHEKPMHVFNGAFPGLSAAEKRSKAIDRIAALGEMTGGIAHDFRNILAVIKSSLSLVERNIDEPDKARLFIAGAREGVDRGVKLTAQLLTFAKLPELDTRPADVNTLLRNLAQFLSSGAGAGIRIVLDLAPDLPKCLLDASQFSAAILNLVLNARDAMPDGGEIRIRTESCTVGPSALRSPAPGAYVRVRVIDSGRGMSAETAGKVFDPFFTTKGERGTGLGLPQVRTFMRMIGGDVSVVSDLGNGTTFDLLFSSENNPVPVTSDRPRRPDRRVGEEDAASDPRLPELSRSEHQI